MIGAIRNVSFGESAQDLINSEGKYSMRPQVDDMPMDSFENKNSKKKAATIGLTIGVILAALAGLGYAVHSKKLNIGEMVTSPEDLANMNSIFKKALAKTKNFGALFAEKCGQAYGAVAGLFSRTNA